MTLDAQQIYINGIPGPTFNFGGLSRGNLASTEHAMTRSRPRDAALQSLYMMKHLADMGVRQVVLPPQERPAITVLRDLGFTGNDAQVLESAYKCAPDTVVACSSASSAWVANSASITPSIDTADGRVHLTPANLADLFHRSLETQTHQLAYYALFPHPEAFVQHDPLPSHPSFDDEGSANQLRLCKEYGGPGLYLMAYGRSAFLPDSLPQPKLFSGRQTREASEAIPRLHRIPSSRIVYAQLHPRAIDAGAFHNDLVAIANQNVLLYHEHAWVHTASVVAELREKSQLLCEIELHSLEISEQEMALSDLIESYFFNSLLITTSPGEMALMSPVQCRENPAAIQVSERLLQEDNPIRRIYYFDLAQSMKSGGGPRCLTLPAVLTPSEIKATDPHLVLSDGLYQTLIEWIHSHYREELLPGDIADPELLFESRRALDELTDILDLGPIYPFQQ